MDIVPVQMRVLGLLEMLLHDPRPGGRDVPRVHAALSGPLKIVVHVTTAATR
jgi:hypothetical protein